MSLNTVCDDIKFLQIDKAKLCHKPDNAAASITNISENLYANPKADVPCDTSVKPTELCLQGSNHLISSITSSLADTPGDSGVLCLDSEASEPTSQALMYHSLIGAEELTCDSQCDAIPACPEMSKSTTSSLMTRSDLDHQNLPDTDDCIPELLVESNKKSPLHENLPDVVLKALESENLCLKEHTENYSPRSCEPKKSLSEDIVFRRRCRKKSQSGPSSQKKRVSFHEDILNNTKTDNIHIERGFVSYGPDSSYCERFKQRNNIVTDRFSWCASGDLAPKYAADVAQQTMSDILTYGDSKSDKSGVFEYCQDYKINDLQNNHNRNKDKDNNNVTNPKHKLYGCDSNSSDSNFSCDSETSSSDSSSSNSNKIESPPLNRKCEKAQKSYSYDGFNNSSHVSFMRKTYFSEADIDQSHDRTKQPLEVSQSPNTVKSVLKKKRYITTNVVEEKKQNNKVLNILDTNNLLGSLKNFYKNFNFNLTPESGMPVTHLELSNVVEALPCDANQNKNLSKSLDSGFQVEEEDDFVEINLNESINKPKELMGTSINTQLDGNLSKEGSPRHKLTLNMRNEQNPMNKNAFPPITKYVVNCESTVYEHKGVSYSYIHDTFQTAFDAPKESFVPIPESEPVTVAYEKMDTESSSTTSTPKRQFNKNLQDEADLKNGNTKHLSSPKKQNSNRYNRKSMLINQKPTEESVQPGSDNCSNTDNSTLKDDYDYYDIGTNQKLLSNKSALLNRYLKSVYQKKDLEMKIKRNKFYQNKLKLEKGFPIVYPWSQVSKTFRVSAERMSRLIDKEVIENKRLSVRLFTADEPSYFDSFEDNVAIECSEKLRLQIFSFPSETLNRVMVITLNNIDFYISGGCSSKPIAKWEKVYRTKVVENFISFYSVEEHFSLRHTVLVILANNPKMMKVQSPYNMEDGSWTPLLVFITDYALYVAGVKSGGIEYDLLCRLPHNELDAIAMGPESQYVQVLDVAGNIACSVVTAEASLGARLATSLEWSARTSPLRPARPPAILPLGCKRLAAAVAKQRHEKKIPHVLFYGRACSGEGGERALEAPGAYAAPLEGYLMCRMDAKRRFEPCYFLLRAGVLYWGPHSPDGSAPPPHSVTLRSVVGVRRRVDSSRRPHCFEIALGDSSRLVLAAPDDHAASSWLQSLLLHAAQALEENGGTKKKDSRRAGPPPGCTVLVTQQDVVSLRETLDPAFVVGAAAYLRERGSDALLKEYIEEMRSDVEILACGSIKNLTAFKIPDSDENWCCLEWSVCEARERGTALALAFASSTELERFIAAVERAFANLTSEPFPLSVVEGSTCAGAAAHAQYEVAWAHMLPAQH